MAIFQEYAASFDAAKLIRGEQVYIVRPFYTREGGCTMMWTVEMEKLVGRTLPITEVQVMPGYRGVRIGGFFWPHFVLQRIEEDYF